MRPGCQAVARVNVAVQLHDLQRLYPHGQGRLVKDRLIWRVNLQPSAFSRRYQVQIEYRLGAYPRTLVLEPKLRALSGGRKPPHVYNDAGDPLCLFYPAAREWNAGKLISRTIMAWTCEWLLHFEAWLFTGEWDGGGIAHEPGNQLRNAEQPIERDGHR